MYLACILNFYRDMSIKLHVVAIDLTSLLNKRQFNIYIDINIHIIHIYAINYIYFKLNIFSQREFWMFFYAIFVFIF